MSGARRWILILALIVLLPGLLVQQLAEPSERTPVVHVIPVQGTIDPVLAIFIARSIAEAEDKNVDLVILEIITLGGRVDAALDIRDAIIGSRVPVVAFVKRRAWSAGALIALACPELIMAPGSSMGAAEPQPLDEKILSALKAEFEATADAAGRDPRLAAAMVDKSIAIEGVVEEGELLTLTHRRALDLGMADEVIATREELLAARGLEDARVIDVTLNRTERLARYIVNPAVAGILLSLGFLGLITEATSPGFGVPGIIGLSCLAAFFGAHLIAGFAGWEVIALFLLGVLLLGVEVFVPGFGVFGVGGVATILFSIYLAAENAQQAVRILTISLVVTVVVGFLIIRFLGRRGFWTRLALGTTLSTGEGYVSSSARTHLVGKTGRTITPLRPAGSARIEDERVDVVTDGDFIPADAEIMVVRIEGMRLIVRQTGSDG